VKDYSIEIKVKNNYLLTQMRQRGYQTAAELYRASGVTQTEIGKMLNLQIAPVNKVGRVRKSVQKLADFLMIGIEDMFPPQNILDPLEANKAQVEFNMSELMSSNFLENKTAVQSKVIKMRHGIQDYDREHTFTEIGQQIGRSLERSRQIYNKGLRYLRHPYRSEGLKAYLEDDL
jgi:DNA-directed RNA polymerase sigma subunit (sigma70/sigma32)